MKLNGYGAFLMYMHLRAHFVSKTYIYPKRINRFSPEAFTKRRDTKLFVWLAEKYHDNELYEVIVANMVRDPKVHVSNLMYQDALDITIEWRARVQALTHLFEKETRELFADLNPLLPKHDPFIMHAYLHKEISPETISLVEHYTKFGDDIEEEFLWPKMQRTLKKYALLLPHDKEKITNILLENVKSCINRSESKPRTGVSPIALLAGGSRT